LFVIKTIKKFEIYKKCLDHFLNSPGNFTASKLAWVKENEPRYYEKIYKIMLPGDYIAMKLTGEVNTTVPGLPEGIFWDFKENKIADLILDHFGFEKELIPSIVPTFGDQGRLTKKAAAKLKLKPNIPVAYRAGEGQRDYSFYHLEIAQRECF